MLLVKSIIRIYYSTIKFEFMVLIKLNIDKRKLFLVTTFWKHDSYFTVGYQDVFQHHTRIFLAPEGEHINNFVPSPINSNGDPAFTYINKTCSHSLFQGSQRL